MRTIVKLAHSTAWIDSASPFPAWLDQAWITEHDAYLLCRLDLPDHLYRLRELTPDSSRLVAYPNHPLIENIFTESEARQLEMLLIESLGATDYIPVAPGDTDKAPSVKVSPAALHEPVQRLQLALVTPMPPTPTGIASYCSEILPSLATHYDITLVLEEPEQLDSRLQENFSAIGHDEFMASGQSFDRVMYHFGNSSFHYDYFMLIKAHPGTVVLHDIYLGDCIYSNFGVMGDIELRQAVYASHGWSSLRDCESSPRQTIGIYPASGGVFSDGYGVIVHNQFAAETLSLFFDNTVLAQLGITVHAREVRSFPSKHDARSVLGLAESDTLFGSFGHINTNKCYNELMDAWTSSGLAQDNNCRLLLLGGCGDKIFEEQIKRWIRSLPFPEQILYTGYLDTETYDLYLAAIDVAVQLRKNSRGESSGALFDCMGAGLPTIVNAHGSMSEVPKDSVLMLDDEFSSSELASALSHLAYDDEARLRTGSLAREYVLDALSPDMVAAHYADVMEENYRSLAKVRMDRFRAAVFDQRVSELSAHEAWEYVEQLDDVASCVGALGPSLSGKQLLVDISAIVAEDLKSGIQRVVRNILRELLQNDSLGYRVEPIYFDFESGHFRYARSFVSRFLGITPLHLVDDVVEAHPGEIYLGLDLFFIVADREPSRRFLQYWRGRGVKVVFVLYDLLPVTLSDCFPPDQIPLFKGWLSTISKLADGIACISRSVADEYAGWLDQNGIEYSNKPEIGYFHLGADLESGTPPADMTRQEAGLLNGLNRGPFLLMVGTVEPRKGHEQVLSAFQKLWSEGTELSLVIVGTTGWIDESLKQKLSEADADCAQLHWYKFVSDAMLQALYRRAAGTIMASRGEGFGLPLIEAAYFGSPLLARDLPVMREVCGDHAWYFKATEGDGLADELMEWLQRYHQHKLPVSDGLRWLNWKESAAQLIDCVVEDRWYR